MATLIFNHSNYSMTAWKVSKYGVISGPYFPIFGLNTAIYFVNLRIQSEYRKMWTRNNSVFGHFSRSVRFNHLLESNHLMLSLVGKICRRQTEPLKRNYYHNSVLRSCHWRCFIQKGFLKISQFLQEFWKYLKNTFFTEHVRATAYVF